MCPLGIGERPGGLLGAVSGKAQHAVMVRTDYVKKKPRRSGSRSDASQDSAWLTSPPHEQEANDGHPSGDHDPDKPRGTGEKIV